MPADVLDRDITHTGDDDNDDDFDVDYDDDSEDCSGDETRDNSNVTRSPGKHTHIRVVLLFFCQWFSDYVLRRAESTLFNSLSGFAKALKA